MKYIKRLLNYPAGGYKKKFVIALPESYDPEGEALPVLWLLDGQNQFRQSGPFGGWQTDELCEAIRNEYGTGFVLVAIDNTINRESELTMNIGKPVFLYDSQLPERTGEQFCDFLCEKIVPYVRSRYNVCWDPAANAIIGSSCGGAAAFCIGMSRPDIFGKIGALSPAFDFFDEGSWAAWLGRLDFTEEAPPPKIFFSNGLGDPLEASLYKNAAMMPGLLHTLEIPCQTRAVFNSTACHSEAEWRSIMPEVLDFLFD